MDNLLFFSLYVYSISSIVALVVALLMKGLIRCMSQRKSAT